MSRECKKIFEEVLDKELKVTIHGDRDYVSDVVKFVKIKDIKDCIIALGFLDYNYTIEG